MAGDSAAIDRHASAQEAVGVPGAEDYLERQPERSKEIKMNHCS